MSENHEKGPKLGLKIARGQANFFRDVQEELSKHFQIEPFGYRRIRRLPPSAWVNKALFQRDLRAFVQRNDVLFFEWAEETLIQVTQLPKTRPIVTRLHSYELQRYAMDVEWERVDVVILVCDAMRRRFLDLYPACKDKAVVVYHGVSLDRFHPIPHTFGARIGMLGDLAPIKRIYSTILALHELRRRGYQLELRIGGSSPTWVEPCYAPALKELVEKLGLQDCVTFDGWVADPTGWLQSIDIFVSNSYWESTQVAMLEAMASGCYCLSHCWGGAEEIVSEGQVFTTERDLVGKMAAYCDTTEAEKSLLRQQMRERAVEKFDIARTRQEICQVVTQVANASR